MPILPYYNQYKYNRIPYYNNYRPIYNNFAPRQNPQTPHYNDTNDIVEEKRKNTNTSKDENVWFDLFGIKLYFDDVLILSLLFFLYKENVKDEGLFLSLVLLLIS